MVPGDQTMPVLNPATEEVLAQCPRASKSQLDAAVAAAKALPSGVGSDPDCRTQERLRRKIADTIEKPMRRNWRGC